MPTESERLIVLYGSRICYDKLVYLRHIYIRQNYVTLAIFKVGKRLFAPHNGNDPILRKRWLIRFCRFSKCPQRRKLVHFSKRRNERCALISFFLISNRSIDKADRYNNSNQVNLFTLKTTAARLAALQGSLTQSGIIIVEDLSIGWLEISIILQKKRRWVYLHLPFFINNVKSPFPRKLLLLCWDCHCKHQIARILWEYKIRAISVIYPDKQQIRTHHCSQMCSDYA